MYNAAYLRYPLYYLHSLSPKQVLALALIRVAGTAGTTSSAISDTLHITMRTTQRILKSLADQGLVRTLPGVRNERKYVIGPNYTDNGITNGHECTTLVPMPVSAISKLSADAVALLARIMYDCGISFAHRGIHLRSELTTLEVNWHYFVHQIGIKSNKELQSLLEEINSKCLAINYTIRKSYDKVTKNRSKDTYSIRIHGGFVNSTLFDNKKQNDKNEHNIYTDTNSIIKQCNSNHIPDSREHTQEHASKHIVSKLKKELIDKYTARTNDTEKIALFKSIVSRLGHFIHSNISTIIKVSLDSLVKIIEKASVLSHPYSYIKKCVVNLMEDSKKTPAEKLCEVMDTYPTSAKIYAADILDHCEHPRSAWLDIARLAQKMDRSAFFYLVEGLSNHYIPAHGGDACLITDPARLMGYITKYINTYEYYCQLYTGRNSSELSKAMTTYEACMHWDEIILLRDYHYDISVIAQTRAFAGAHGLVGPFQYHLLKHGYHFKSKMGQITFILREWYDYKASASEITMQPKRRLKKSEKKRLPYGFLISDLF